MKIPKPTDADRDRFRSLVPDEPDVETKPMFGNLGVFVNGNMFMGLFGSDIGVKLDEPDRARARGEARSRPLRTRGSPDGRLRHAPPRLDAAPGQSWIAKAHAAAAARPPKQAKKKAAT